MRFIKKIFCLAVLFTMAVGCGDLEAANLHVIAVGDLAAKDLKSSVEADLEKVQAHAQAIADHTGMSLIFHPFSSGRRLAHQILQYVRELDADEDDTIIFYYSGHGYRPFSKKGSPWPNMYFSGDEAGLELELVSQVLQDKQTRLVIIMADCCNNVLMDFLAPPLVQGVKPTTRDITLKERNYRKLFCEACGLVTIASSKPGQFSYSVDNYGGLFTNAFLNTFDALVSTIPTEELNWQLILEYSIYITAQYAESWGVHQDPIFQVDN